MPSLRQLLPANQSALLLDAASARIQVGLIRGDGTGIWACTEQEAGSALFTCIESLKVDFNTLACFLYCEGPGSILGIRCAASALRAWQLLHPAPVFAYRSLTLVAESLASPELAVIADARRDTWHLAQSGKPMRRVPSAELPPTATLRTPSHFRAWSKLPPDRQPAAVPYDLQSLLPRLADADLFHASEHPDAFLHEEPSYVTWTPGIHRAPTN